VQQLDDEGSSWISNHRYTVTKATKQTEPTPCNPSDAKHPLAFPPKHSIPSSPERLFLILLLQQFRNSLQLDVTGALIDSANL
jgi:hypothetical protein